MVQNRAIKKKKIVEIKEKEEFTYEIEDIIKMEPTGTLTHDFKSNGKIFVSDKGESPGKGRLWEIKVVVNEPPSLIEGNIRARNIDASTLKIGVFIYKIELDLDILKGLPFGRDAVLFAGRVKIRDTIKTFAGYL